MIVKSIQLNSNRNDVLKGPKASPGLQHNGFCIKIPKISRIPALHKLKKMLDYYFD